MFSHDIIKIKYVNEGYLPNYPYHLISDEEMLDAFLTYPNYEFRTDDEIDKNIELSDDEKWRRFTNGTEPCYFRDHYPLYADYGCGEPEALIEEELYRDLVEHIVKLIEEFKQSKDDVVDLPDWVYSYMIGSTLGIKSDYRDLHDMFVMLGSDNDFDEFKPECASACYEVSCKWIAKTDEDRPPTMFGEPHVLKSLRLDQIDMSR